MNFKEVKTTMTGPYDAKLIADLGAATGDAKPNPTIDGVPYVVVPDGYSVQQLPTIEYPPRKAGTLHVHDVPSFVRFFKDHSTALSRVYADENTKGITGVIDDWPHDHNEADWRQHRVHLGLAFSDAFKRWAKSDRERMSQTAFGEFLQDVLPDVLTPSGAELLEMAMNFEASSSGSFTSAQRMQDGSATLVFRADTQQVGQLKLPSEFRLHIPIFRNGASTLITARLRYRLTDARLTIWYELVRPNDASERAFDDVIAALVKDLGDVVLRGIA